MMVNYPQTTYSSCMYYNIPTILVTENKFYLFKKSLKMFNELKKNNMAFNKFEDASKYIIKNWDNIYYWWNSDQIQKIRKLYLKIFSMLERIGLMSGQNLLKDQKKKSRLK